MRQGEDANTTRFITAYGRDVDQPETQLQFDPITRHLIAVGSTRRDAHAKEALGDVLDMLEQADEPLSVRAVEAALDGVCPRDRVRAALNSPYTMARFRSNVELTGPNFTSSR